MSKTVKPRPLTVPRAHYLYADATDTKRGARPLETTWARPLSLPNPLEFTLSYWRLNHWHDYQRGKAVDAAFFRSNRKRRHYARRALPYEMPDGSTAGVVLVRFIPGSGTIARHFAKFLPDNADLEDDDPDLEEGYGFDWADNECVARRACEDVPKTWPSTYDGGFWIGSVKP